jgi:glutaredoxin-related protein
MEIQNSRASNFPHIKIKKEYMERRLILENTFLLFVAYDENTEAQEDNETLFDFLDELKEKFSEYLEIVLFSNKSEDKLLDVIKEESEKEKKIEEIQLPRLVLCHPHLTDPQLISEFDAFEIYKIIKKYFIFYKESFAKEKEMVFQKIKALLDSYPVVVFIKGTPHDPFCKFSKSFINTLKETKIKYKSFNIFKDDYLRCYLRLYSGWKTYPQIYINSKIVGGVEKLNELVAKGEFMDMVPMECKREGILNEIQNFFEANPLIVMGKGTQETSKCKNTLKVYEILKSYGYKFELYDVLKDEMAKNVIKEVYKFEHYPAIFLNAKYIGGGKELKDAHSSKNFHSLVCLFFKKNLF